MAQYYSNNPAIVPQPPGAGIIYSLKTLLKVDSKVDLFHF